MERRGVQPAFAASVIVFSGPAQRITGRATLCLESAHPTASRDGRPATTTRARSFCVNHAHAGVLFGFAAPTRSAVPAFKISARSPGGALRSSFVCGDIVSYFFAGQHLDRLLDAASSGNAEAVAEVIIRAVHGAGGERRSVRGRSRRPDYTGREEEQGPIGRLIAALQSFFRSASAALGRRFRAALIAGLAAASIALTGFAPAAHASELGGQGDGSSEVVLVAGGTRGQGANASRRQGAPATRPVAATRPPAAAARTPAAAATVAAASPKEADPEGMEISKITVEFFDEAGKAKEGRTKPFVVLRELQGLQPGGALKSQNVMLALRRLHQLGIFRNVGARVKSDPAAPGKVELIVLVEEHDQTGSMNGGAGLGGSGLIGNFSLSDSNFRGRNQKVAAEVTVGGLTITPTPGFDELLFNVGFRDPWLRPFGEKTGFEVNVFNEKSTTGIFSGAKPGLDTRANDDSAKVLKWRTGGNTFLSRSNGDVGVAVGGSWNRIAITDPHGRVLSRDGHGHRLTLSPDGQDDLVLLTIRGAAEGRDIPRTPSSGTVLRWQVDQALPVGKGKLLFNRAEGKFAAYIPLPLLPVGDNPGNGQTLVISGQAGHIQGALPPYEAFSLGGVTTVRGYTDGELGAGRSYALGSAEYRLPVTSKWGVFAFLDAGTDLGSAGSVPGNPAGVRGKPGHGFGFGGGIRGLTGFGPVTIQFGFRDGKGNPVVQLGLGERF